MATTITSFTSLYESIFKMTEWQVINGHTLQRDLKGAEFLINATEQHQGGNVSGKPYCDRLESITDREIH